MNKIFFFSIMSFFVLTCQAQKIVKYKKLKYKGYTYESTLNSSFVNKRIVFSQGLDSVIFNVKIPFDAYTKNIHDPGIFYNCLLNKDAVYSFELKKISLSDISNEYNSYYRTNAKFTSKNDSKFVEIKKDTQYQYKGIYGLFVDINHELLIIDKMSPTVDCVFQH